MKILTRWQIFLILLLEKSLLIRMVKSPKEALVKDITNTANVYNLPDEPKNLKPLFKMIIG